MKNAMKKLFSLVLVAVLLVSALPFQASAAELIVPVGPSTGSGAETPAAPAQKTTVYVVVDDVMMHGEQYEVPMGSTVADIFDAYNGTFADAEYKMVTDMDGKVVDGSIMEKGVKLWLTRSTYTVTLKLTVDGKATQQAYNGLTKADADDQWDEAFYEPATTAKYIDSNVTSAKYDIFFNSAESAKNGYTYVISLTAESKEIIVDDGDDSTADLIIPGYNSGNGSNGSTGNSGSTGNGGNSTNIGNGSNNNTGSGSNGGLTDYTKFAYPVYLNIYTDTTVGTVKKTVNITDGIAKDGVVTLAEVKSVVEYYYNSVDTDKGIQYDGLYPAQGNWVHNYVHDQKYERIEGLYEAAAQNYVYINVMITNATAGSTSTADSTNPKTGDAIFAPMAVMAVSASALALFFFYNKKRAI